MVLDRFLNGYDFSNFRVEDLKKLNDTLTANFSSMKEDVSSYSAPKTQTLAFSTFNKSSRVQELQRIKAKNNNTSNNDNNDELDSDSKSVAAAVKVEKKSVQKEEKEDNYI